MAGNSDKAMLQRLYTELRFCVADLKPGFDVIVDLSRCNLIYIESLKIYKKIIDYLIGVKVGEIIRIIDGNSISSKQIKGFTRNIQTYKALYVGSMAEAEAKLAAPVRRSGIRFNLTDVMVEYSVAGNLGKGFLFDISTSGCAIKSPTTRISGDVELDVTIFFSNHEILPTKFSCRAQVVRQDGNGVAVRFLGLTDSDREQLYERLSYEASRDA